MRKKGLARGRKWNPPGIEGWEQKMCNSHRPLLKKQKKTLSFGSSWLFIQLSPPMRFHRPLSDPDSAVFILFHCAWLLMQSYGWKKKELRVCCCQHHFLTLNWVIGKYLTNFQSSTRHCCSQSVTLFWHNGQWDLEHKLLCMVTAGIMGEG